MTKITLAAALVLAATAMPAHAGYITVTYSGIIDQIYDGLTFTTNEPITASVTFDPSKLVDHTAAADPLLVKFGLPTYASILTASLSDDPGASMTIKIGSDVFTKFDQANYGTPTSDTKTNLENGDFPLAEYLNGQFSGIGGVFQDAAGAQIYTDPIAAAGGDFDGHSFYIDNATSDAEGDFDIRDATYSAAPAAVPEPTTWAMMIGGIGLIGGTMRRGVRKSQGRFTRKARPFASA